MPDSTLVEMSREDRALRCVIFQVEGVTFEIIHFDTKREAKAHAESFVSIEPRFQDEGLTERFGRSALKTSRKVAAL